MSGVFDRFVIVDADAHVTEPPDLWTSRLPAGYRDEAPHVERRDGVDMWVLPGGLRSGTPGQLATAFFRGEPTGPSTFEEIHPAAYDARARLALMDDLGLYAQILYPNVGGFGATQWMSLPDEQLALACVRAYNDFLVEWAEPAPDRLLGMPSVPFWNLDEALGEVTRCIERGSRGVNFPAQPGAFGLPHIWEHHWDPLWALAQEAGIPVNFHIGSGNVAGAFDPAPGITARANITRVSATLFMNNLQTIADIIFGGVCHRFPDLQFVSVESGAGFMISALETFDWQWRHQAIPLDYPEYDLLPSEYFRRQISACFWFERASIGLVAVALQDNLLYETDFPHPASQYPAAGPDNPAVGPRRYADEALGTLPDAVLGKLLFENAARIYRIKAPAGTV
jgi:predicted TIM-barrel fold metal-dependent hydrolase